MTRVTMAEHNPGTEFDPDAGAIFGSVANGHAPLRVSSAGDAAPPALQLLSNGRYQVMLGAAGTGYSHWNGLALTRWREDATRDNWGAFCYLRAVASRRFWSCTRQPAPHEAGAYRSYFWDAGAVFDCHGEDIDSRLAVVVAPDDDIEVRRLTLSNRALAQQTIDVTSYAEVVLGAAAADDAHPAFSKLFVESEILPQRHAILCTRRSGSAAAAPWMFHLLVALDGAPAPVSYETDRMQFVGRG
ncbi:MAG TPA: hypothetical protein VL051_03810, partial [Burkholderiaceae bacterium]|nr:hypothetical protein [Burkholderiaceae bacterium]